MNPAVRTGTPAPDAPHIPVAIVGAGACGLVAALALRDAGVECVLLERDAQPSGSTALSSGFIPAAGTAMQRAAGIQDSPAHVRRRHPGQGPWHGGGASGRGVFRAHRRGARHAAGPARHHLRSARRLSLSRPQRAPHARRAAEDRRGAGGAARARRHGGRRRHRDAGHGARTLGRPGRAHHRRRLRAARRAHRARCAATR
jgi:fumarate reductase flavoprotein subunit